MDTFGIAYRPALAASVFEQRAQIDVLEVIADDYFGAGKRELAALALLGRHMPTRVHAVSLGLATCARVDMARVYALARVVDAAGSGVWSEHLAFVRAGGIELGHLCAPPRTPATLEGLARNVARARRVIGSAPALENVATLIDPPCSELDEAAFVRCALELADAPLLLDLHNLHANARNFDWDPIAYLDTLPLSRVRSVHLAGGRLFQGRVLDDHQHAVPEPVYTLLEALAARVSQPLEVIVERDGRPPPLHVYLAELARARLAVTRGRAQQLERSA